MYGQPIRVQSGRGGFTPSRFQPMRQMGAMLAPAILPGPSPMIVRQNPTFIVPSTQPVFVSPSEIVAFAEPDNTKVLVIAAIGLLALGAAIL